MPIISRFFGIVIYMYWRDHTPPHFHAKYQDQEVVVNIETGEVMGQMGNKATALIQEWRELHIVDLMEDWNLAQTKRELKRIEPLE